MSTKSDIKALKDRLLKIKNDLIKSKSMKRLGDKAAELIRIRTRLGNGVDKQGDKKHKFDKLSTGYKNFRKRNKPPGKSTASKSNLTYTGKMLDDLEAKQSKAGEITIGFKTDLSKSKAEWVSDKRPFNHLSKSEIKQLEQFLEAEITKLLKK